MVKKRRKNARILDPITSDVVCPKRKKGDPMLVGYVRVSMNDQNNQRQIDELVRYGVHVSDIFQDKKSGKTTDREGWQNCLRELQDGDVLVVYSLDRLGRNLGDLISIEKGLYDRGVKLKVLAQDINTSSPSGRLVFHMLGALSQWEREWSWERTMHGLASARDRGRIGGVKETFTDKQIRDALRSEGTINAAAKKLGCMKITIIRRKRKWEDIKRSKAA